MTFQECKFSIHITFGGNITNTFEVAAHYVRCLSLVRLGDLGVCPLVLKMEELILLVTRNMRIKINLNFMRTSILELVQRDRNNGQIDKEANEMERFMPCEGLAYCNKESDNMTRRLKYMCRLTSTNIYSRHVLNSSGLT